MAQPIKPTHRPSYAAIQNCRSSGGTQCDLFKHSVCALPCDITKNGCYFDQPLLGSYGHFNGQVKPVGLDKPDEEPDENILRIIMRHPRQDVWQRIRKGYLKAEAACVAAPHTLPVQATLASLKLRFQVA